MRHQVVKHHWLEKQAVNCKKYIGTTFYDCTGHGFDATSPGLGLATGIKGQALNCPGSGFDLAVANSMDSFALNTFSIEAWYNPTVLPISPAHSKILDFSYVASGVRNGFSFGIDQNAQGRFTIASAGGGV